MSRESSNRKRSKKGGVKGSVKGDKKEGPQFAFNEWVARLVPDPKEPPDLLLLSGYLGASSEEGNVRLYLDEGLSRHVEIPEKAIRHTQELTPEQSPPGGSLIWIDREAQVLDGKVGAERRPSSLLEGQIAQGGLGVVARGVGAPGGVVPSVPCITPLISRRIPCQPPNPFLRQHYLDFLWRDPTTAAR